MIKTSGYSEAEAIGLIDKALDQLKPEEQQRVIDWAVSKYRYLDNSSATVSRMRGSAVQQQTNAPGLSLNPPANVKSFMAAKKPTTLYERVACLVYYLEKAQNKEDIATADITQANTDARLSKMSNPSKFVNGAVFSYGYISGLGARKYAISARGEALVDALPDRAKVEEALDNHPFRRKTGKNTRKKAAGKSSK